MIQTNDEPRLIPEKTWGFNIYRLLFSWAVIFLATQSYFFLDDSFGFYGFTISTGLVALPFAFVYPVKHLLKLALISLITGGLILLLGVLFTFGYGALGIIMILWFLGGIILFSLLCAAGSSLYEFSGPFARIILSIILFLVCLLLCGLNINDASRGSFVIRDSRLAEMSQALKASGSSIYFHQRAEEVVGQDETKAKKIISPRTKDQEEMIKLAVSTNNKYTSSNQDKILTTLKSVVREDCEAYFHSPFKVTQCLWASASALQSKMITDLQEDISERVDKEGDIHLCALALDTDYASKCVIKHAASVTDCQVLALPTYKNSVGNSPQVCIKDLALRTKDISLCSALGDQKAEYGENTFKYVCHLLFSDK